MPRHLCERIVAALSALETDGFSRDLLAQIHHLALGGKKESFARARWYFERHHEVRERNRLFAERLFYIQAQRSLGRASYATLVREALQRWPLV